MKLHPRFSAAAWFGLTGIVPGFLWNGSMDIRQIPPEFLRDFILFPCIAAAISGALFGHGIPDSVRVKTKWGAFWRGALVGIASVVFYATISAAYHSAATSGNAGDAFSGVFSMTLYIGLLFAGWAFAIIWGISGLLFHKVARQRAAVDATTSGPRH